MVLCKDGGRYTLHIPLGYRRRDHCAKPVRLKMLFVIIDDRIGGSLSMQEHSNEPAA